MRRLRDDVLPTEGVERCVPPPSGDKKDCKPNILFPTDDFMSVRSPPKVMERRCVELLEEGVFNAALLAPLLVPLLEAEKDATDIDLLCCG